MELDIKKPKNQAQINNYSINLYDEPPRGILNLEECQDLFRQRLEVLHLFESLPVKSERADQISYKISEIRSDVFKTNCFKISIHDENIQKMDHNSHMLARLFCITNSTLWDRFKKGEKRLLYYRLRHDRIPTSDQLESILKQFNFDFERVAISEYNQLKKEKMIGWNSKDKDHEEVFKIHFQNALKFIARRSVALKGGYAYLTRSEIISVVCDVFEKHLEDEFTYGIQHLDLNDSQIRHLLKSLSIVYEDFQDRISEESRRAKRGPGGENQNPFRIDVDDIEDICKNHYPPCIRYLHESLKQDHHLKHSGRLIYGTFLRSGGVDMESAIEFWRKEFTKKIPNDKFERDYKYNIRHLYGREGHKKALSCFSCDKVISDAPGPTDKHGCPFKHFDENNLKVMMTKSALNDGDIDNIMSLRNDKEYKLACSHYFKSVKGEFPSEPIRNPIQFYFESKRLQKLKENPPDELDGSKPETDNENQRDPIKNHENNIPKTASNYPTVEDEEMFDDF